MEWVDGAAKLITASTPLLLGIGGAFGWWIGRRDAKKKTRKTEAAAISTVETLEETVRLKNDHIATMGADYARSREIVEQQDQRLIRKDARIAHLETLLDKRGAES